MSVELQAFQAPSSQTVHPFRRASQLAAVAGGLSGLTVLALGWLESSGLAATGVSLVLIAAALGSVAGGNTPVTEALSRGLAAFAASLAAVSFLHRDLLGALWAD